MCQTVVAEDEEEEEEEEEEEDGDGEELLYGEEREDDNKLEEETDTGEVETKIDDEGESADELELMGADELTGKLLDAEEEGADVELVIGEVKEEEEEEDENRKEDDSEEETPGLVGSDEEVCPDDDELCGELLICGAEVDKLEELVTHDEEIAELDTGPTVEDDDEEEDTTSEGDGHTIRTAVKSDTSSQVCMQLRASPPESLAQREHAKYNSSWTPTAYVAGSMMRVGMGVKYGPVNVWIWCSPNADVGFVEDDEDDVKSNGVIVQP